MMPKTLNVEKLEKKFASLTRSRESIQGLSSWIMLHKEFCKEIVQEWLSALSKDFNTLTMFYVANDVIQNCSRKKAPEFRDAFSTALEKAVCLEKVRGIKKDVSRLLRIWNEREIYDDAFFKRLENRLNAIDDEKVSEVLELTESEIISNFQVKNLINCLQNLRKLEDLLQEKEVILKDLEEPAMPNLENLIVKMDSQSELRKLDEYYDSVEEYITLASSVEEARKVLLRELKYSSVYYTVQNEDVKKVAHAYRIYGKKLKIIEKTLSEKISDLGEKIHSAIHNDLPYNQNIDLNESQKSSDDVSLLDINAGDTTDESHDLMEDKKQSTELKTESFHESISPINSTGEINSGSKEKEESVPIIVQNAEQTTKVDAFQSNTSDNTEKQSPALNSNNENMKDISNSTDGYSTEVDFLLEKAYDNRHIKCKSSIKRKIETLLNAKGKKTCHTPTENDKSTDTVPDNHHLSNSPLENPDTDTDLFKAEDIDPEENSTTGQEVVSTSEDNEAVKRNSDTIKTDISENLDIVNKSASPDIVNKEAEKDEQYKAAENKFNSIKHSNICLDNLNSGQTFSTDSVFNALPDIPTELLRTILNKNKVNMARNADSEYSNSILNKSNSSTEKSDANLSSQVNAKNEQNNAVKSVEQSNSDISEYKSCSSNDCLNNIKISALKEETPSADTFTKDKDLESVSSTSKCSDETQFKEGTLASTNLELNVASEKDNLHIQGKPNLMETLKDVFKFISGNEASLNRTIKDAITRNPPKVMPIENTLKLYSYMMRHYGKNFDKEIHPSNELKPNESVKMDVLNVQTSTMEHSSTQSIKTNFDNQSVSMPVCGTKEDNLEIMDMEVDSGEENMES